MPRQKKGRSVKVNHEIPYQTLEQSSPPIRAHRQAAWEQILHLKAGDLDPARVQVRARQRELYTAQEIIKELEAPTRHEEKAIETVEVLLERAFLRTVRKGGV
jgi:hypothetical protein